MDRRTTLLALGGALPLLMTRAVLAETPAVLPTPPAQAKAQTLQLGRLAKLTSLVALERSANTLVKGFAHSEVVEQKAVAMALTSEVSPTPVVLTSAQSEILYNVKNAPDSTFDSIYLHTQIVGHEGLLKLQRSVLNDDLPPTSDLVHIALLSQAFIEYHLSVLHQLYAANQ